MTTRLRQSSAGKTIGGLMVSLVRDQSTLAAEWQKFEQVAVGTLYQSYAWCSAWSATVGEGQGVSPLVLVARNNTGEIQFLLPLQIRKRLGVFMLEWQTHPHGNYGFGLFEANFYGNSAKWFDDNAASLWSMIPEVQLLHLAEMPALWAGQINPLSSQFNLRGPNDSYLITLQADYETLYAERRSKSTRKTIRKRDGHLAELGKLTFGLPRNDTEAHGILDVMFKQQEDRLAESGVYGTFGVNEHNFMHKMIDDKSTESVAVLPYTLKVDDRALSVILCATFQNNCYALITSLAHGPERKYSPGDAALRGVIAAACVERHKLLDLSTGAWDYKLPWADVVLPLHTCLKSTGWRGLPVALYLLNYYGLKRMVKQSPIAKSIAYYVRALK
jgi:CelD/BcsL family acetyltransferase involved in cellulose biosynthesis